MTLLSHFFEIATDASLVRHALAERPEAFEALIFRYQRKAHAVARGLGVAPDGVDDVVQDSFLSAFRDLQRLRDPGAFGPWLLSIVRNVARDHASWLAKGRAAPLPEDLEAEERDFADEDFVEYLWRRVGELPEATREAVFLYYYDGESTRSVARSLGITVSAVKSRLEHGRKLLREKLWREMERCLRGSTLPSSDWRRNARRLTLAILVASPAALVPGCGAETGSIAAVTATSTGVLLMSAKKLFLLAAVFFLLFGGGVWLVHFRGLSREVGPDQSGYRLDDKAAALTPNEEATRGSALGEDVVSAVVLAPPASEGTVAGTVFLIDPGTPAANAMVAAVLDGERRYAALVTTGEDGTYRLAGLAPGIYRLGAWKESWCAEDMNRDKEKIEVRAGETADAPRLLLVPGAAVTVEVISIEAGEPVAGATVDYRGRRFATTDDRGVCRLEGLSTRSTRLTVTAEGFAAETSPAQVVTGEESFLRVLLAPGGLVEGRVTQPDGRPAAGAKLETSMSGGAGSWFSVQARADEHGRYRLTGISLAQRNFSVSGSLGGLHKATANVGGFPAGEAHIELDLQLVEGIAIAGRVVDFEGSPVADAEVVLDPWREASVMTDTAGDFRIAGAPGDLSGVVVRKRDFAPTKVIVRRLPAEEREALKVALEPANVIGGTVVDTGGKPIAAATVHVWTEEHSFFGPVTTDRAGRFQLVDMPSRLRDLWASKPGYLESSGNPVKPGGMDHRVVLGEGGQIHGLVVDRATAAPLNELTVKVLPGKTPGRDGKSHGPVGADISRNGLRFSGASGFFTVRGLVPDAFYQLVVVGESHLEIVTEDIEAWPESEARTPLRIEVESGRTHRGKVVSNSTGEALRGVRVRHLGGPFYDPSAGRYSWFIDAFQQGNPTFRTALTGAGGSFTIGGLSEKPGTLLLEKSGFARTAFSPFIAPEDEAIEVFRLTIEAVLEGTVTTAAGVPIQGAEVTVVQGTQRFPSATADAQGAYRIDGLLAGVASVEVSRPWGLRRDKTVILLAGEVTILDFAEPEGAIAGVVTAGAAPVPVARVSLRRFSSEREDAFVSCDARGAYRLEGLSSGAYQVSATRANDWRDASVLGPQCTAEVDGAEARCDLEFSTGALHVQVVDRLTGLPAAAAHVTLSVQKGGWRLAGTKQLQRGERSLEFDLLPAGAYYATAWTKPGGQLAGWTEPVELAEGQPSIVTLLAGGANELKLIVLDAASGAPVRGASVRLNARRAPVQLGVVSGEEGAACFQSVPPAVWDLEIRAAGHADLNDTIDLAGESQERTVRLEPSE